MTDTKRKRVHTEPMAVTRLVITAHMRQWIGSQECDMSEYVRRLIAKDMAEFDEEMEQLELISELRELINSDPIIYK